MFAMEKSQELVLEQRRSRTFDTAANSTVSQGAAHTANKEKSLVDQAQHHKQTYEDNLLAINRSMEEEEEDHVDFRPPSPFRRQTKIPRAHHHSKRKSHSSKKESTGGC